MVYRIICIVLLHVITFTLAFAQENQNPSALDLLVETEIAFSRASEQEGMSAAFLEYFEKGGLAFVPDPQTVEIVFGGEQTAYRLMRYHLLWRPLYGDISAAEDLGYITGVSERKDQQNSSAPVRYGAFFSVWRRQPDGSWKVLLDCGTPTPQPIAALDASFSPSPIRNGQRRFYKADNAEIFKIEQKFYRNWQKKGARKAYLNVINQYSRLHRTMQMPVIGAATLESGRFSEIENMSFSLTKTGISKSGDLGFAYGTYEAAENIAQDAKKTKGVFFRVWQRNDKGKWNLVVDVRKGNGE